MEGGDNRVKSALVVLWKAKVPSKVQIFGWRLVQDRLPAKFQLVKRGIIHEDVESLCVFGCNQVEDVNHLFIGCYCARRVWRKIFGWLRLDYVEEAMCCDHFLQMVTVLKPYCANNRVGEIWLAVCWCLQRHRNDIIFNNVVIDPDEA
ncbi:uncharacterized protein LOC131627313 [Vicia villosa]|uniref:uncharacterized protein LOC131627313 n=1 Tax=Vicia villosa TaxID=3911 RepID=UPI00273ABDBB|nr:uncharacterized protein LOC131627313 [Vicia villosa]